MMLSLAALAVLALLGLAQWKLNAKWSLNSWKNPTGAKRGKWRK
jgi:hypothetical protein